MAEIYDFIRESMEDQRVLYKNEHGRNVAALSEDYQAKLKAVSDKINLVWERCDRRCANLEKNMK